MKTKPNQTKRLLAYYDPSSKNKTLAGAAVWAKATFNPIQNLPFYVAYGIGGSAKSQKRLATIEEAREEYKRVLKLAEALEAEPSPFD